MKVSTSSTFEYLLDCTGLKQVFATVNPLSGRNRFLSSKAQPCCQLLINLLVGLTQRAYNFSLLPRVPSVAGNDLPQPLIRDNSSSVLQSLTLNVSDSVTELT